jgi:hypothetical protein
LTATFELVVNELSRRSRRCAISCAEPGCHTVRDDAAGFALPALRNSVLPQSGQAFSVDALLHSV